MNKIFKAKPREFRKKSKRIFVTLACFRKELFKYGFELFSKGMKNSTNENLKST